MQQTVNDFMKCYDESEQKDGNTNNLLYKEIVNIIAETQKEGNAPKRAVLRELGWTAPEKIVISIRFFFKINFDL